MVSRLWYGISIKKICNRQDDKMITEKAGWLKKEKGYHE